MRRLAGLALLVVLCALAVHAAPEFAPPSKSTVLATRLHPGDDLRPSLMAFARSHRLQAAFIVTVVGSVREAHLRLADKADATLVKGPLEIVSLVGTLSADSCHLHMSVADGTGRTVGGHLVDGCPIYTTAEVVLGEALDLRFTREVDAQTTFKELRVLPRP